MKGDAGPEVPKPELGNQVRLAWEPGAFGLGTRCIWLGNQVRLAGEALGGFLGIG